MSTLGAGSGGMTDKPSETNVHIRQLEQELLDLEKQRKLLPKGEYEQEKARIRSMVAKLSSKSDSGQRSIEDR